jgi:hypothetical protein
MSGTTETVLYGLTIPAGLLQPNDRLRVIYTSSKSGAVENGTINIRVGTTGTTADPILAGAVVMPNTTRSYGLIAELKVVSPTSIRKLGNGSVSSSFLGGATATLHDPVSVGGLTKLSISSVLAATAETLTLVDVTVELLAARAV